MKLAAAVVTGLVASSAVASCASSRPSLDAEAAKLLQTEVAAARATAASGNVARADELLQAIGATVAQLRHDGRIGAGRAGDIVKALGDTEDALHAWAATSTTAAPTSPSATPRGNGRHRGRDHNDD